MGSVILDTYKTVATEMEIQFLMYNVLLAIATNIPVLLMTAFVLQGHIWYVNKNFYFGCD